MKTLVPDHTAVDRVIELHRGLCPALALGVKVARVALAEVGSNDRDHEVIAVAEGDTCAVDAVQALTGCTIGNRDLIVRDEGKVAFTFWRRSDGKGVRVTVPASAWHWTPEHLHLFARAQVDMATEAELDRFRQLHRAEAQRILDTDPRDLLTVTPASALPPPRPYAQRPTVTCGRCGELVTGGRTQLVGTDELCIPCARVAT